MQFESEGHIYVLALFVVVVTAELRRQVCLQAL